MFSFFKKKGPERPSMPDVDVWMTRELKIAAICAEVRTAASNKTPALVITHFWDTFELLKEALAGEVIPPQTIDSRSAGFERSLVERLREGVPVLMLSEGLPELDPGEMSESSGSAEALVIIAEIYPTPERDERAVVFARALPYRVNIRRHVSLDEPPVMIFISGGLVTMMERLGADDGSAIRHPMVTRSIFNAQEKIEKKATGSRQTRTAEEWMMENVGRT